MAAIQRQCYLRRGKEGDRRRLGGGAGEGDRRLLAGGGEGLLLLLLNRGKQAQQICTSFRF